jgi:hypothetical protein
MGTIFPGSDTILTFPLMFIKPDLCTVLLPQSLDVVNVTEYSPFLLYVCTGFVSLEVFPSPKFHFRELGEPVLLSVKLTVNGMLPEAGEAEKLVRGASETFETAIYPALVNE